MTTRPIWHAIAATSYIVLIVSGIFSLGFLDGKEETILIPMTMLSLIVLSVAVMGYLFFFEPVRLLTAGKVPEAAKFFLHTVGAFAVFTAIILGAMLAVSFS